MTMDLTLVVLLKLIGQNSIFLSGGHPPQK